MKKWINKFICISFFVLVPLTMSFTCYTCETYGFTIDIIAGEGTTEPPPGMHFGYNTWNNRETIRVIPAEGWHIEKITKNTGTGHESEIASEYYGICKFEWYPSNPEITTLYYVYFAKDTSTNTSTTTTTVQGSFSLITEANNDAYGNVTAEYSTSIPSGTEVHISAGPKEGYKFLRWELYGKDISGQFTVLLDTYYEDSPTITVDRDIKAIALFELL